MVVLFSDCLLTNKRAKWTRRGKDAEILADAKAKVIEMEGKSRWKPIAKKEMRNEKGENARNWRLDRSIWEGKSIKTLLEAYALIDFPEFHTTEVSEIAKNENDKWIKINSEMPFRRLLYNLLGFPSRYAGLMFRTKFLYRNVTRGLNKNFVEKE